MIEPIRFAPAFALILQLFSSCSFETVPEFVPQDYSSQTAKIRSAWAGKQVELTAANGSSACLTLGSYCSKTDSSYETLPDDCRAVGEDETLLSQFYCDFYTRSDSGTTFVSNRQCQPCGSSYKNYFRISFIYFAKSTETGKTDRGTAARRYRADLDLHERACSPNADPSIYFSLGQYLAATEPDLSATDFGPIEGASEQRLINSIKIADGTYCQDNYPVTE